jgi:transcription-repair coupling factor (superfamily II helicase)
MELGHDKSIGELTSRLAAAGGSTLLTTGGVVKVAGTWGSFAHLLAAHLSKQLSRPIIYVCPHIDDADNAIDDLQTFGSTPLTTGGVNDVQLLPAWEGEEEIADATDEIRAERLKTVSRCSVLVSREKDKSIIIAASMQAISQPVPKLSAIESGSLALQTGKQTTPEDVSAWLIDNGFERTDKVDLPGQFARRGGIVDIYAPMMGFANEAGQTQALRIEFFGDTIESIRTIDLDTQVSTNQLSAVSIVSATCGDKQEQRELFLNILPADAIVILDEPADCQEVAKVFFERAEQKERLYNWPDIYKSLERFTQLHISRFATENPDE